MYTLLLYVHVLAWCIGWGVISARFFPAGTCFAASWALSLGRPPSRS